MNIANIPVYTVSQVNGYVKSLMDQDDLLTGLLVRGEISNYKCYPSGHHYFSLKDEQGSLRCVMFRGEAVRLRFRPANGMRVVAFGRISVFPRDGQYQLYCNELIEDGRGALDEAFERLRRRLEAEGLFDPANKQNLPRYPGKIALVTSPAGAAVRDMLRILGARWPLAEVLVAPVRVQGREAAGEIAAAIHRLNNRADIDLIIAGRGGGSKEDLWAFNEEVVARAIYLSNIPVISAVGHEPDVTIADFVADVRAATPSHAAELAVPDQAELLERLQSQRLHMLRSQTKRLELLRRRLTELTGKRVLTDPMAAVQDKRLLLDHVQKELCHAALARLAAPRKELAALAASLDAMSPLKVLGRGFALVTNNEGKPLRRTEDAPVGSQIAARLSNGRLVCRVEESITEEEPS